MSEGNAGCCLRPFVPAQVPCLIYFMTALFAVPSFSRYVQ